jgi:hypothetical protein
MLNIMQQTARNWDGSNFLVFIQNIAAGQQVCLRTLCKIRTVGNIMQLRNEGESLLHRVLLAWSNEEG